jgi:hypothetical protein
MIRVNIRAPVAFVKAYEYATFSGMFSRQKRDGLESLSYVFSNSNLNPLEIPSTRTADLTTNHNNAIRKFYAVFDILL